MAGMTSERLRRDRHLRWPCPSVDHPGTERLYLDRKFPTPSGRARFHARPHQPPRETTDHEFPRILTTGRLYAHWHTLTRTGKSPKLVRREPSPFVEVHPDDAAELGLAAGQWAELSSRRGLIRLPVKINPGLSQGLVFVPFHQRFFRPCFFAFQMACICQHSFPNGNATDRVSNQIWRLSIG
jgi:ferredoxin-nitrate reductase